MPKDALSDRDIERILKDKGDLSDIFDRCARDPELLNDVILLGDIAHGILSTDVAHDDCPAPGSLARYQLSRASLDEVERVRLAQHLEGCARCGVDLTALAAFDFSRLPQPLATPRPEARPQSFLGRALLTIRQSSVLRYGFASAVSLMIGVVLGSALMHPTEVILLQVEPGSEVTSSRSATVHVALARGNEAPPERSLAQICPGSQLVCSCAP